jgi:hypothetical protein
MQRWGVFSVIDHKDEIRLATELMLYDKIAVPTPIERDKKDLKRWQEKGWEPKHLTEIIRRPNLKHLFIEAEWDLDRQKNWKIKFEQAKAAINKVNSKIQQGIDNRVAAAAAENAHRSKEERDAAIQAAAYAETKDEVIRHLNRKRTVAIHYGPVEFFAAYQSRAEFEALHHTENSIQQGVEHVNFLIRHRLAVPDLEPKVLLDRVAELTSEPHFKERRRLFYDWQIDQLQRARDPETVVMELNQIVYDFNAAALANDQKCRWETVVTVMAVAGGAVTAWAGFDPTSLINVTKLADAPRYAALLGGLNTMGIAALRKTKLPRAKPDAPQRIAAAGAMFHQMDADTGFQFRTVPVNSEARDLPRRS